MTNTDIIEKVYNESVQGIKEEWLVKNHEKWYSYIKELPSKLKTTYVIVVLHNQVMNGGLHQYFLNGYGQFVKETIEALREIGAFKKSDILNQAFKEVNSENLDIDIFINKLQKKDIPALYSESDLDVVLDDLDALYYETDDIEFLLGNYLKLKE